jgi:hypothetical protein
MRRIAYRLNLGVVVERNLVFIVYVVELLLCDLDSRSRDKEDLCVSHRLLTFGREMTHFALF